MGSGTAPPNQYVTLDHEHILVFRKGENPESDPSSSYFWNERNRWFSDIWDVGGDAQQTTGDRDVAASFPLEVPLRLILMYSSRGDLVLDPFGGTGTTGVAAAVAGRDSVCYDIDESMRQDWKTGLSQTPAISEWWIEHRIRNHIDTVRGRNPAYKNTHHETSVMTQPEEELRLHRVDEVSDEVSYSQVGEFGKNRLDSF